MRYLRLVTNKAHQAKDIYVDSLLYTFGIVSTIVLALLAELSITNTSMRTHIEHKLLLGKGF